jgi:predicted XRE-type DNA-binding protein
MIMKKRRRKVGSANPFADVHEKHRIRAQLIKRIDAWRRARRLRQVDTAWLLGTSQADVSQMLAGQFQEFSLERLLRFLVALGQDVEIVITTPHRESGTVARLRVTEGAVGPGVV